MNNYLNSQYTSGEINDSPMALMECLKNDISEYSRGVAALRLGQNRESAALLDLIESRPILEFGLPMTCALAYSARHM